MRAPDALSFSSGGAGRGARGAGRGRGRGRGGRGGGPSPALLTSLIRNSGTAGALLGTCAEHAAALNHIHLAAAWNALGRMLGGEYGAQGPTKLGDELKERTEALCAATARKVAADARGSQMAFRARELATVAHGAAKSGAGSAEVFGTVAEAAAAVVQSGGGNAQELANLVWSFAKAQHEAPALLEAVAAAAAPRLREFKPQELSNLVWGFATARHAAPALLDAVAAEAAPRLREFNEQALSTTFWAYATAKHAAPALFDAMAAQVSARPAELTAQGLSTVAWACATAKFGDARLLGALAREAKRRARGLTPQQLAQLLWAFAKADFADTELFGALASTVAHRLGDFGARDIASASWALAKACHADETLFKSLASAALRRVDDFGLQDAVNTAWAFAKVGQSENSLFDALARSIASRRLDDLDVTSVANVAWAFSKAGRAVEYAELFCALARSSERRAGDLAASDLASLAWTFANANQLDGRLFTALARAAGSLVGDFNDEERDNAEWAFSKAGEQAIVQQLRRRKASAANATASASAAALPAETAAAVGRIVVAGGGIGGAAAALALQSAGFDVLMLEADASFDARKQGYGLTIQGTGATQSLGISLARDDAPSTSHYTFSADGRILGFFAEAFNAASKDRRKCGNSGRFVHVPRQALRARLIEKVRPDSIRWGCKLASFECTGGSDSKVGGVTLTLADGSTLDAALLVGCDGIFSTVRRQLALPGDRLNYVGLICCLGIVPTTYGGEDKGHGDAVAAPLAYRRIFETVDGSARIYAMPFTTDSTMWQLSFPLPEEEARRLAKDPVALKSELLERCGKWHAPVPALLRETPLDGMAGYPVYDRPPLETQVLRPPCAVEGGTAGAPPPQRRVTLMGDAAHPMTPFKAQGANQALSDAVLLAECLAEGVRLHGPKTGVCAALPQFERRMLSRSARVVTSSREKAKEMHSSLALQPARKVQRESGLGGDMQKAIGVLRAEGVGAHSVSDPRGLEAVVAAAIVAGGTENRKRRAATEGQAAVSAASKAKRWRKDASGAGASADASLGAGAAGKAGFKWRRVLKEELAAAGEGGLRRKSLRKAVLAKHRRHAASHDGAAAAALGAEELKALFKKHVERGRDAGWLRTDGKVIAMARPSR